MRETHISNADSLDIDSGDHFLIYWLYHAREAPKKWGIFKIFDQKYREQPNISEIASEELRRTL